MPRVIWKKNKVISIETKNNIFTLAQMLVSPYLLIFNEFSEGDKWDENIDLNKSLHLMTKGVTRQFLRNTNIVTQKSIKPANNPEVHKYWIRGNSAPVCHVLFEGTEYERMQWIIGNGGDLIKNDPLKEEYVPGAVVQANLGPNDHDLVRKYELTSLEISPNFSKRLYYCYLSNRNIDPQKDLIFGFPLLREYIDYFEPS